MGCLSYRANRVGQGRDATDGHGRSGASPRCALAAAGGGHKFSRSVSLEYSARRGVNLLRLLILTLLICSSAAAGAQSGRPFFNVSTNRSFAPEEKPQIHLYTRNESELE